ncbi:unnamed protein product [Scytosiphon promiscuus]
MMHKHQRRQGPKHVGALVLILAATTAPAASFGVPAAKPAPHAIHSRVASTAVQRGGHWRGSTSSRTSSSRRSVEDDSNISTRQGQRHPRGWWGLRMSYDGGDFPSDVGDDAGSSGSPVVLAEDNPELRETMKREILSIAATSNRGQVATQEEKDSAMDLIYQLEALNPTPDATNVNTIGGPWELVYTDTQPFRCSPFFMALGEVFGEEKGQAETLFSLHRAATSNGEIGRVRQTISEAMLVSEIDLKVGLLPGLPMALKGTVVTKARLNPISSDSFTVSVESTSVTNNNILSFLDSAVEVPIEQVYSTIRGSVPESKMSTYYLDDDMRISRMSDDHVFVFVRSA